MIRSIPGPPSASYLWMAGVPVAWQKSSCGNLASHLRALEENKIVKMEKGFIGRKTNTTYAVTKAGEKAFSVHLAALEEMIKGIIFYFLNTKVCISKFTNTKRMI